MIHPSDLLRVDSNRGTTDFMAPIDIVPQNQLDCGISAVSCLNRLKLERFAKPSYFLTVLSLIGLLQGITIQYFRGTSRLWSEHYNINQDTVDWLIYADEIIIGFVALPISYWGCRHKRPPWIGSLTVLLSVSGLLLIAPECYHDHIPRTENSTDRDTQLCVVSHEGLNLLKNRDVNYIGIVLLCSFEAFFAMASVSYITHGITYVDDNISCLRSSSYVGLVIAMREIGKQIGIYASWAPLFFGQHKVFLSAVWITLICLNCLMGTLMIMFPKNLPSVIVNRSAVSILQSASGAQDKEQKSEGGGISGSVSRLSKNRVLLVNIMSGLFVRAGMINMAMFSKPYDQSRFLIKIGRDFSGYNDPPLAQFSTNLLRQPLVAIFAVTSGMYIARNKPKAKSLFIWNIAVFSAVALMFLSTAFFNCDQNIENELKTKIIEPYCSAHCGCTDNIFEPVCVGNKTYFSPCMAGCTKVKYINKKQKIFEDCLCPDRVPKNVASEGACDADFCNTLWALSQSNNILVTGILASTLVINLVINMRVVLPEDKGMALGLELTFISIIPYLPIRAAYGAIAEYMCQYTEDLKCIFYSTRFGLFMSLATILMTSLSIMFASVLLCIASNIELYKEEVDDEAIMMESITTNNRHRDETRVPNDTENSGEDNNLLSERAIIHDQTPKVIEKVGTEQENLPSDKYRDSGVSEASHPSLEELEDVGDDHDSSASFHDAVPSQEDAADPSDVMTRKTSNEQLVTDF